MKLTPRLHAVAQMVAPGARFADVGTDHAFLPVWLIRHGVIESAIASDLRSGPLERAKGTARRYDLEEQMDFRLCDGLQGIRPDEVDTIAIAGMGGETINHILSGAPWTKSKIRLILQPMSSASDLRQWLDENGYCIEQEKLVCEGRTLYTILCARGGEMKPLTPAERWAGRQTREMQEPLRSRLLDDLVRRARRALEGVKQSSRPEDLAHQEEIQEILDGLVIMREEWEKWQQ